MKGMIRTLLLLLAHLSGAAQVPEVSDSLQGEEIIDPVEIIPSFPGGHDMLIGFVKKNQKRKSIPSTIKGKVFVEFVVEKTGELTEIKILRGLCDECDKEAIRLVKAMPNWTPGSQGGKLVRTRMVLPLLFNQ